MSYEPSLHDPSTSPETNQLLEVLEALSCAMIGYLLFLYTVDDIYTLRFKVCLKFPSFQRGVLSRLPYLHCLDS